VLFFRLKRQLLALVNLMGVLKPLADWSKLTLTKNPVQTNEELWSCQASQINLVC